MTHPLTHIDDAIRALKRACLALDETTEVRSRLDAATVQRARLLRTRYFAHDLFSEPSWDILLEVAAREEARKRVSVSGACIVAGIAGTTGLRHVDRLVALGLIARAPDRDDRRRFWLRLTEDGRDAIDRYMLAASQMLVAA